MEHQPLEQNPIMLPQELATQLRSYVEEMPKTLYDKYMLAIKNEDPLELLNLFELLGHKLAYEQEKSDDRCASLVATLKELESWLDRATK